MLDALVNSTCVYHVYNHVYSNYAGKHLNPISLVTNVY